MEYWGLHTLIDGRNFDLDKVRSIDVVKQFVAELVVKIDMVPYGPLWVERFATHDADKTGISFFQMIMTSNISGHLVDKDGSLYIDIFSCKDYDVNTVQNLIRQYFGPGILNVRVVNRDAHKFVG